MEIIERIRNHPLFAESYQKLQEIEKDRVFCRHQMEHLLDVARIAHIYNLEGQLGIRREVIYAAALLHDIGKSLQYTNKIPHEEASAEIAEQILKDVSEEGRTLREEVERYRKHAVAEKNTGQAAAVYPEVFSEKEQADILLAIRLHRKKRGDMPALAEILYTADKQSRACYACAAEPECNWSEDKKNWEITL